MSTVGVNDDEEPKELVRFLKFVGANSSECEDDYGDAFIRRLQESIKDVKVSREMGGRYMIFQEMLKDERAEGKAEAVLILLKELGAVPEQLQEHIMGEKNLEVLTKWVKLAAKSNSIEEFVDLMWSL